MSNAVGVAFKSFHPEAAVKTFVQEISAISEFNRKIIILTIVGHEMMR